MSLSYLLGAMHDGTVRRTTIRISQKEEAYVRLIREIILAMGGRAWTYREGKSRRLYVVEFSRSLMGQHRPRTRAERLDYVRGYFDAEGGVPRDPSVAPYVYFAQNNREDLAELRTFLVELGIGCGRIHNPTQRAAPEYWRFYVSRPSIREFARLVGSWHPRKGPLLLAMATAKR